MLDRDFLVPRNFPLIHLGQDVVGAVLQELLGEGNPQFFALVRRAADGPPHRLLAVYRGDKAGKDNLSALHDAVGGDGNLASTFAAPEESPFGPQIAELVDGLTKLARYHLDRAALKDLTHSKIFISASRRLGVLIVALGRGQCKRGDTSRHAVRSTGQERRQRTALIRMF